MSEDKGEEPTATPQELAPVKSWPIRAFQMLLAWLLLAALIVLIAGFLFFVGLAIWKGIIWLWPW
jgi:uncharacterized membrane protein